MHKLNHNQFIEKINSLYPNKYDILGEYITSEDPILVKYNECGHVCNTKAKYIRQGKGCPICNSGTPISPDKFEELFNQITNNECELLESYKNSKSSIKIRHKVCGTEFSRNTGIILGKKQCNCPKCNSNSARQLVVGVNDIHTTNSDLEKVLLDKNDAYNYTQFSKEKTWFECPYCKMHIYKQINNVARCGLNCPNCNTSNSLGERIIACILSELRIDYTFQYSPKWIKPYRYDFFFIYDDQKYILEIDGGWHFSDNKLSGQSLEEIVSRDNYKNDKAKANGYNIIRLNYNYKSSDNALDYLRQSISESEFSNIFDLSLIDWEHISKLILIPQIKSISDLWNTLEEKSISKIVDITNLSDTTVRKYIYKASELGIISENIDEIKKINNKYRNIVYGASKQKKIRCVQTNEIFNSLQEANKKYHANIGAYLKYNNRKFSGTLQDGTRLTWELVK